MLLYIYREPINITVNDIIFGDPRSSHSVSLECISPEMLLAAENSSHTPESLATQLLLALFTEQELSHGNCTKPHRSEINLLDQTKIKAIKGISTIMIKELQCLYYFFQMM